VKPVHLGEHPIHPATGRAMPAARLSEEKVRQIRRRAGDGENQSDLGREYRVTRSCINDVVRGKTWTWVI